MFASQFLSMVALPFTLTKSKRDKVAVAVLDYSLTCHYHEYPTQINEAVAAYRAILESGIKDVILIGDSAGGNLALAVARFLAYPEEAKDQFLKYSKLSWDFSPLPQPKHLILISPWVQPYTAPELLPGVNVEGDLGSKSTNLGDWYVEGLERSELEPWVKFTDSDYATLWANVDALNGTGKCLYIYGEREILRESIERFLRLLDLENGSVEVHKEDGGIHVGSLYVEGLDFYWSGPSEKALAGDFGEKYGFNLFGEFLDRVIS